MELSKPCELSKFKPNSGGYPVIRADGKVRYHHIVICEAMNGPRPKGEEASHLCGNKRCVEPTHLIWETPIENNARKSYQSKHNSAIAGEEGAKKYRERNQL